MILQPVMDMEIGTIRAAIVAHVVRALDMRSGRTDFLLHEEGLSRASLDDGYNLILLKRYVRFFERAAIELGDDAFGFKLGTTIAPADLGPVGTLFANAPTLGHALDDLCSMIGAVQSSTRMYLKRYGDTTTLIYRIVDPAVGSHIQDSEFTLAATCAMIRSAMDVLWSPSEVHFRHGSMATRLIAQDYFRTSVRFGMPAEALMMRTSDLQLRSLRRQGGIDAILRRHVMDLIPESDQQSVSDQVAVAISLHLSHGNPTLGQIARDIGIRPRSLQRALSREGNSLRSLLQQQRILLADKMLRDGRKSHAEIAQALGYADATVFWRAFKTWTGTSPSQRSN